MCVWRKAEVPHATEEQGLEGSGRVWAHWPLQDQCAVTPPPVAGATVACAVSSLNHWTLISEHASRPESRRPPVWLLQASVALAGNVVHNQSPDESTVYKRLSQ